MLNNSIQAFRYARLVPNNAWPIQKEDNWLQPELFNHKNNEAHDPKSPAEEHKSSDLLTFHVRGVLSWADPIPIVYR